MKKYLFQTPRFIKTAIFEKDYPKLFSQDGKRLPEIAVIGRSNVGKSSLLNHLFKTQKLVKTSSTPGKTQALNFFTLNEQLAFVDLPGYGYAKTRTSSWKKMAETYFETRETLKLVLFLLDIRRTPSKEDLQMCDYLCYHDLPTICILTKVDKVKRGERQKQTALIKKKLPFSRFVHYSATKNEGRVPLMAQISEVINEAT